MKSFLFSTLILVIVIIGGVYALTGQASIPQPEARVVSFQGEAKIKKQGTSEWLDLSIEELLKQGDAIKTGQESEIVIDFYNQSISRIGPQSEVNLDELFINQDDYGQTKVGLGLTVGRVWSRVVQLLDKESEFGVKSSATVATVRGTAFDFEVSPDNTARVSSLEGRVQVSTVEVTEEIDQETGKVHRIRRTLAKKDLLQGQEVIIDQNQEPSRLKEIEVRAISSERKESQWFKKNIEAGENFEGIIKDREEKELKSRTGFLPDSKALYSVKRLAERARLAVVTDSVKRDELEKAFAARRVTELFYLDETRKKVLDQESRKELKQISDELLLKKQISQENILWLELRLQDYFYFQKIVIIELEPGQNIEDVLQKENVKNLIK